MIATMVKGPLQSLEIEVNSCEMSQQWLNTLQLLKDIDQAQLAFAAGGRKWGNEVGCHVIVGDRWVGMCSSAIQFLCGCLRVSEPQPLRLGVVVRSPGLSVSWIVSQNYRSKLFKSTVTCKCIGAVIMLKSRVLDMHPVWICSILCSITRFQGKNRQEVVLAFQKNSTAEEKTTPHRVHPRHLEVPKISGKA